jgi:hypothetical protein
MASAASALPRRKSTPANRINEPLPVLKSGYTQLPNSVFEVCRRLDGTGVKIFMAVSERTYGGRMPDGQPQRDKDKNILRPKWLYTSRDELAYQLGVSPAAIDKQTAFMRHPKPQESELGVIEIERLGKLKSENGKEDYGMRVCLHPENFALLPEREPIVRKKTGTADTPDFADSTDRRSEVIAHHPPIIVPAGKRSEWQTLGPLPQAICYDNQRREPVVIAAALEEDGIVITIPESHSNVFNDIGATKRARVVEHSKSPPNRAAPAPARSDFLFGTLCEVFDRCGKPLSVALSESCKRAFLSYPSQTQERIIVDACAREQHLWDKPKFTPSMERYLESRDWDLHPIKPRAAPESVLEKIQKARAARK